MTEADKRYVRVWMFPVSGSKGMQKVFDGDSLSCCKQYNYVQMQTDNVWEWGLKERLYKIQHWWRKDIMITISLTHTRANTKHWLSSIRAKVEKGQMMKECQRERLDWKEWCSQLNEWVWACVCVCVQRRRADDELLFRRHVAELQSVITARLKAF